MSSVEVSITIDAPPQQVFDTVMNPELLQKWVTIHRDVTVQGDGKPVQGARMDQVLALRGVSFKVHWTLDTVNPPHEAQWQGQGPAGSKAFIGYKVAGPEEGPTTFSYTNEFSTPGGVMGKAASRVVVGNIPEREAERSLERLKELVEGG
jgi:uncharacterized protein YndB with AHSA1/START domain